MIQNINIDKLIPHKDNPRKELGELAELAESIKARGVMQNLTVVPYQDGYKIVIGHRRHAAAKLAGLTELPCAVVDMDEKTQISTMLLENIQRSDLTVYEQAQGFQMMIDLGDSVADVARQTGFAETTVRHRVNLMQLNKKKLAEAATRGGALKDYIALEKIKGLKLRNSVLEKIGTRDFEWALKGALQQEAWVSKKRELIVELNKWAKPIPPKTNISNLQYVTGFYSHNEKNKLEKPKDADTEEYYFSEAETSVGLYRKSRATEAKPKSGKEKSFDKRESKLKALSKRAYELRYAFVKNFTAGKTHADAINTLAFKRLIRYGGAELSKISKMLEIEMPEGNGYSEAQELMRKLIFERYVEHKEQTMLVVAYVTYDDKPGNDYYCAKSWNGFVIEHENNSRLDDLYDSLIELGYEMSEEETALRDGTHELLDKPDCKGE